MIEEYIKKLRENYIWLIVSAIAGGLFSFYLSKTYQEMPTPFTLTEIFKFIFLVMIFIAIVVYCLLIGYWILKIIVWLTNVLFNPTLSLIPHRKKEVENEGSIGILISVCKKLYKKNSNLVNSVVVLISSILYYVYVSPDMFNLSRQTSLDLIAVSALFIAFVFYSGKFVWKKYKHI